MANKQIENLIDNDLSDTMKATLFELQTGRPSFMVNEQTVEALDERDLVNRIQYTSTRSTRSVEGWALSERGNQVVEAIRRRASVEELQAKNEEMAERAVKESKKSSTNKKTTSTKKKNG